jgi:hypothetical protein
MTTVWLLMALTCSAHAPHRCGEQVLATYPKHSWCTSGKEFIHTYPQARQIKVWCRAKKEPAHETHH